MNFPKIENCPGTLAQGFETYSPIALRRLFKGRQVSHILPYVAAKDSEDTEEKFMENRKRISISGVQEKLSLILIKNQLRLTQLGEHGTYILKPIPRDVKNIDAVPANEHLTMQIARQVYGITTAENALVFFESGEPAYLTLRFDVRADGSNWRKEDFASLAGKSKDTGGPDYKYHSSNEEMGSLIRQYVPAWRVEIEKYFRLVVFNYLFSNGDAHLKNYGLLETAQGDFILSPAYDLLNTKLHVNDTDFGLNGGLFADTYKSASWKKNGHAGAADFVEFGKRIGIPLKRIEKLLSPFLIRQELVELLTTQSYLSDTLKRSYLLYYNKKRNLLNG
ncbi:HipA domain-containing protein [Pedobacter sp. B4-66]|uniref:type II toxin-antitoxin system HipA family toxin n=1 Tax=Pedobacter sp. B4-66 TaxID=2817280 RepID=UPI001BDAE3DE|nr:HipA domain-containing protein [Pedobacter sp. B4-66]